MVIDNTGIYCDTPTSSKVKFIFLEIFNLFLNTAINTKNNLVNFTLKNVKLWNQLNIRLN